MLSSQKESVEAVGKRKGVFTALLSSDPGLLEVGAKPQDFLSPNSVNVLIACRHLVDLDLGSGKSDPFAVMFLKQETETTWHCLGKTEVIFNNLNPDFLKSFTVNYYFEKNQSVRIEIYDHDDD